MFKNRPERPVAFNVGMGIGKALEVGGQYYNDVAVELRNQEALEEARQYQTSERVAGQKFQEGLEDKRNEFTLGRDKTTREQQLEDLDRSEKREDERNIELRNQDLEDQATTMEFETAQNQIASEQVDRIESIPFADLTLAEQTAYITSNNLSQEQFDALKDSQRPYQLTMDANGNKVVLGADPEYNQMADGNWTKRSAVSDQDSLKESQSSAQIRLAALDSAMLELVGTMVEGFDTRGGEETWNRLSRNLPMSNYLTTGKGQRFTTARNMAGEALFKAFSGAAGSDAEADRYYNMLPTEGDMPETVQMKLRMLSKVSDAIESVSGMPSDGRSENGDWRFYQVLNVARQAAADSNFDIDTGEFINPDTGEPDAVLSPGALEFIDTGGDGSGVGATPTPTLSTIQLMNRRNLGR